MIYNDFMRHARTYEVLRRWKEAAETWRLAADQCPEESRERGYCLLQAEACERLAERAEAREAAARAVLVADAVPERPSYRVYLDGQGVVEVKA